MWSAFTSYVFTFFIFFLLQPPTVLIFSVIVIFNVVCLIVKLLNFICGVLFLIEWKFGLGEKKNFKKQKFHFEVFLYFFFVLFLQLISTLKDHLVSKLFACESIDPGALMIPGVRSHSDPLIL